MMVGSLVGMQADTVLERELRVLHPDLQEAERERVTGFWAWAKVQAHPPVTCFFQQSQTYSKKATPPNPPEVVPLPMNLWMLFSLELQHFPLWPP